jgi:hypothetical protein
MAEILDSLRLALADRYAIERELGETCCHSRQP